MSKRALVRKDLGGGGGRGKLVDALGNQDEFREQ